jgi:hypothetical protein
MVVHAYSTQYSTVSKSHAVVLRKFNTKFEKNVLETVTTRPGEPECQLAPTIMKFH